MALRRWGCVAVVAMVAMVVVVMVVPVRVRGPVGAGFPSITVVFGSPSTVTAHCVPAQAPLARTRSSVLYQRASVGLVWPPGGVSCGACRR